MILTPSSFSRRNEKCPFFPFSETLKWGRVVSDQIKRQDIEAFRVWKSEINQYIKQTRGEELSKYLEGLTSSGAKLQTRMGIAENHPTIVSLSGISQVRIDLCIAIKDYNFI